MSQIALHHGDNRDHLRRLIDQGVRVHSVVTDPPYGLTSITKRFGNDGAAPAKFGSDGAFKRASAGFMGSAWDGTGIERDPEFWRLIWEILLPGGYVVAFSGSRTGHWQACAMEMAGFIMHPMLGWVYGSGFPKAHNAAKAIDATLLRGSARTTDLRQMAMGDEYEPSGRGRVNFDHGTASKMNGVIDDAGPRTPEAQQWDGWAYGGQALKPALEPIFVGQKPFSEKNGALNLLKHGVGAINIDGCRVSPTGETLGGGAEKQTTAEQKGNEGWTRPWMGDEVARDAHAARVRDNVQKAGELGRHPANLLHDGSDDVVALFPQSTSGAMKASTKRAAQDEPGSVCYGTYGGQVAAADIVSSSGSAARFFNAFPDAEPIRYQAKASKADRAGSRHPTVKPVALMQWLVRLVTPAGGTVLDPFGGSGTTGEAARREGFKCILMEAEDQFADDIRRRFGLADDDFDSLMDDEFAALL